METVLMIWLSGEMGWCNLSLERDPRYTKESVVQAASANARP